MGVLDGRLVGLLFRYDACVHALRQNENRTRTGSSLEPCQRFALYRRWLRKSGDKKIH